MTKLYKHTCEKCGYFYLTYQKKKIKCGKPFETPLMQKMHSDTFPDHLIYSFKEINNSLLQEKIE